MILGVEAEKFLLYAYFGITENDENAKLKCAERAYLDANRNMQFVDELKSDKGKIGNRNKYIKRRFKEIISQEIVQKIEELNSSNFDSKHHEICRMIKEKSYILCFIENKEEKPILKSELTYGLAQKWLNMTLKYMWLLGLLKDELKDCLHVPVDSYIMEAAAGRNRYKEVLTEGIGVKLPHKNGGTIDKYIEDKVLKWSNWMGVENFDDINNSDYHRFQQQVRKTPKTPIEWENNAWIEISERVNKEQKKVQEKKFNIKVK